ncbi:hypothetical protein WA1_18675 [Scytonema hofmannii PCC 7110]|uniref:Uncharacterized protein n=1 Tax=Scytonema hofmannii PCC 7110 TaxID=128403 RepID=A0A139XBG4_9CYAN|nr:hypothetical protein [Scytonema hofmannii]KYC42029.1 hypothetical protein WA1_18675 [Scytonema hofmannii PCC 7110]
MNNRKQAKRVLGVFSVNKNFKVCWNNLDTYQTYKIYLEGEGRKFYPKQVGKIVTDVWHATTPNFLMKDHFVSEVYLVSGQHCVAVGWRPKGSLLVFDLASLNPDYRFVAI